MSSDVLTDCKKVLFYSNLTKNAVITKLSGELEYINSRLIEQKNFSNTCYELISTLNAVRTISYINGNKELGKTFTKVMTCAGTAATIGFAAMKLSAVGFSIGPVGAIIGAISGSFISLFVEPEQDIVAQQRHEQVMSAFGGVFKCLAKIHRNIMIQMFVFHKQIIDKMEHLEYRLDIQDRIIFEGFTAMSRQQTYTQEIIKTIAITTQNKLDRLKSTQFLVYKSIDEQLSFVERNFISMIDNEFRTALTEASFLIGLDIDYRQFQSVYVKLYSFATTKAKHELLTGVNINVTNYAHIAKSLHRNIQDKSKYINLITKMLEINIMLPNINIWCVCIDILIKLIEIRFNEGQQLNKEHTLKCLVSLIKQGIDIQKFINDITSISILQNLGQDYESAHVQLIAQINDEIIQFESDYVIKMQQQYNTRLQQELNTISSNSIQLTPTCVYPAVQDITVTTKTEKRRVLLNTPGDVFNPCLALQEWFYSYPINSTVKAYFSKFMVDEINNKTYYFQHNPDLNDMMFVGYGLVMYYMNNKGWVANNVHDVNQLLIKWFADYETRIIIINQGAISDNLPAKQKSFSTYKQSLVSGANEYYQQLIANIHFKLYTDLSKSINDHQVIYYGQPLLSTNNIQFPMSDQTRELLETASVAQNLSIGYLKYTYNYVSAELIIDAKFYLTDGTVLTIAQWEFPLWKNMWNTFNQSYGGPERVWIYWNGGDYKKYIDINALKQNPAHTEALIKSNGFNIHRDVINSNEIQEKKCDNQDSSDILIQKIVEKREKYANLFNATLIEKINDPGSLLHHKINKFDASYQLIHSMLTMSIPIECKQDDIANVLSGFNFLRDKDDIVKFIVENDSSVVDQLRNGFPIFQNYWNNIVQARENNEFIIGQPKVSMIMRKLDELFDKIQTL